MGSVHSGSGERGGQSRGSSRCNWDAGIGEWDAGIVECNTPLRCHRAPHSFRTSDNSSTNRSRAIAFSDFSSPCVSGTIFPTGWSVVALAHSLVPNILGPSYSRDHTQAPHQGCIFLANSQGREDSVVSREPAAQTSHDEGVDGDFRIGLEELLTQGLILCHLQVGCILQSRWCAFKGAGDLNQGDFGATRRDDGEVGAVIPCRSWDLLFFHLGPQELLDRPRDPLEDEIVPHPCNSQVEMAMV